MGRIDRYLFHRLLAAWGFASLVLVLVFWVNRAIVLFDQLVADGQGVRTFLEFSALALPTIVRIVLPLAALAATLYAVNRLTAESEITVLRAAGASPARVARPVLCFGLLVGLLVAILAHVLAPLSVGRLMERQREVAESATARILREGEFVSPVAGVTLYVRDLTPEGELRGLLLSDGRDPEAPSLYTATTAYLVRGDAGPQIVMIDGTVQRLDRASGRADGQVEGRLAVTTFADLAFDLGPLLGVDDGRRSPRELWSGALLRPTPDVLAATGRGAAELRAEAHDRMAEALLAPVAALLAAAAMLAAPWSRYGAWQGVGAAAGLAIGVKAVESVAVAAAGDDPRLWPLYYLPSVLGALAAAGLLWLAARPRRVAAGGLA